MADGEKVIVTNRAALHEYHVHDKYEAGIALTGTEVKSVRAGLIQLKDSYVAVREAGQLVGMSHLISGRSPSSFELVLLSHSPVRFRLQDRQPTADVVLHVAI